MNTRQTLLATVAISLLLPSAGAAQGWMPGFVSAEFVPGWQTENGNQMTALRIVLEDDWKTYWRAPGDAGVPPSFDWHGSRNVGEVIVHWPRPQLFENGGMRTAGYASEMILPIEVVPADPTQDVWLAAEVSLGICHDICVPLQVNVFDLLEGPGNATPEIISALSQRPELREDIASCAVEPVLDGVRLTAEISMPALGGDEVALFELDGMSAWFSDSSNTRDGAVLTSTVEIVPYNARPFELNRQALRITVLGNDGAVEIMGCSD
ncbi:protein-disulfide reductase DsbD domain-containing protein [Phaeovulum sp.]|uniref:protein-disulfide reductase DsbD domain-containing protein n=1 Tax=Phaeovulum sp. TaxID=2934796 RepID=UPI003567CC67